MTQRLNQQNRVGTFYTANEEAANVVTHGIGLLLSIIGAVWLLPRTITTQDGWRLGAVIVYALCTISLYLASTLYHSNLTVSSKRLFRKMDHACIYLMIAGTYTPFLLIGARSPRTITLFSAIWLLAIVGVIFKVWFTGYFDRALDYAYVVMAWMALFNWQELRAALSADAIQWVLVGGASYMIGFGFYLLERLPFNHAVWHLFVLAGTTCHFVAMVHHLFFSGT